MARMVGDVFNGIGIWSGLTVVSSLRSFLTTFLVPSIEVVSQSGSMGYVKWRLGRRLALMPRGVREDDLTCIQYICSGHVILRKHPKSPEGLGRDEEDEKKALRWRSKVVARDEEHAQVESLFPSLDKFGHRVQQ
jgi:hypothetical protein